MIRDCSRNDSQADGFGGGTQKYFVFSPNHLKALFCWFIATIMAQLILLVLSVHVILIYSYDYADNLARTLSLYFLGSVATFMFVYLFATACRDRFSAFSAEFSLDQRYSAIFHGFIFVSCIIIAICYVLTVIANQSGAMMLFPVSLFIFIALKHLSISFGAIKAGFRS
jgi:hypothetical protein